MLSDPELLRYARQILLPQIDLAGQQKLKRSTMAIVGLGGLGSPVVQYLAAAGVGRLILIDFDRVELSNLQRQPIHQTDQIGQFKVNSAAQHIAKLNPHTQVSVMTQPLAESDPEHWLPKVDMVLDCSDNFATRHYLNQMTWQFHKPLISAAVVRFEGQLTVFDRQIKHSPCYRCLYAESSDQTTCSDNGVLSPAAGMLGCMQAVEAIKHCLNIGTPLVGKLLIVDVLHWQIRTITLPKDKLCSNCGFNC